MDARTRSGSRAAGTARMQVRDGVAEIASYWIALPAVYLLQGSLWFFAFKPKLFDDGTRPPPSVEQQFDGSIVDRTIGIHAAWVFLGVLELLVFATLAVSFVAGELLPTRTKPWLLGALAGAMFTLGVLMFGTTLTSDTTTSAQLYAYFAGTAVQVILVLLMPPYRSRPWLPAGDASTDV